MSKSLLHMPITKCLYTDPGLERERVARKRKRGVQLGRDDIHRQTHTAWIASTRNSLRYTSWCVVSLLNKYKKFMHLQRGKGNEILVSGLNRLSGLYKI